MINRRKILAASVLAAFAAGYFGPAAAWIHGGISTTFNNGKFQTHLNYPGVGGNYAFINELKGEGQQIGYSDLSSQPAANEFDANMYPLPGANGFSHGGYASLFRIMSTADGTGARVVRVTGKGTVSITSTTNAAIATVAASSLITGNNTAFTLASTPTYAFRKGMEVPFSGTVTGVSLVNATGTITAPTGSTTAWTVCNSYNGVSLTVPLCLNDQTTALQTTGTASGAPTVSYGRTAIGVTTNGRLVYTYAGSPVSLTILISATDATTPVSDLAVMQPKWEGRWDSCTLPGKACFSPDLLALTSNIPGKPAWERDLNLTTAGNSQSNMTDWAHRKPATALTYAQPYPAPDLYAGSLTSSSAGVSTGNDYQLTFGSGAPTHGQQVLFRFNADPVTVSVDVTAAQINWTNHNLVSGQPFMLFASNAPGLSPSGSVALAPTVLYVLTVVDANHFTFSTSVGGAAVATTSSGSNVFAHATVVQTNNATVSGAPTTDLHWPGHLLNVNDPVVCNGTSTDTVIPAPLIPTGKYFVKGVTGVDDITISNTVGGAAITFTTNVTNFKCIREPTLSLNGTTAVPIRGAAGLGISISGRSDTPLYANGSKAGVSPNVLNGYAVYDSVLGAWLKTGADISVGNTYVGNWWPPEIFLEYCKQIGAHPWFVSGAYTLDPPTDYLPNLMTYVKNNKASWQVPGFETPNESWNNAFYTTKYQASHGYIYARDFGWATGSQYQVLGKSASLLGQIAANVFGASFDSSKYQVIIGMHTADLINNNAATNIAPRETASEFVAQSAAAGTLTWAGGTITFAKDPAYKWATHAAIANYFAPSYYYSSTLPASLGASFAGGRIKTGTIDSVGNGTGVAGNILNATAMSGGTLDIGTQLFAPGIASNGITSPVTITKMSPTAGCGGTCSGTGGTGTYEVSQNVLVGAATGQPPINFIPSTSSTAALQSFVDSSLYGATFTATLTNGSTSMTTTGTTGTVTVTATGTAGGEYLMDSSGNTINYITINSQSSGTTGSDGTYALSAAWPNATTTATFHSGAAFSVSVLKNAYAGANSIFGSYCNGDGSCNGTTSFAQRKRGYEGGYSPDVSKNFPGPATSEDMLIVFGKFVSSSPGSANGLEGYVSTNCQNFTNNGGEYCSLFQMNGIGPSSDDWSALPDYYLNGGSAYWRGYINLP